MDKTIELADATANSVSESIVYKDFIKAKKEIIADTVLYEKMKNFKKAHSDFCAKRAAGGDIPIYEEINVSRMYFELLRHKTAKEYLKNEQILIKLMSNVYEHLSVACIELFTGFES